MSFSATRGCFSSFLLFRQFHSLRIELAFEIAAYIVAVIYTDALIVAGINVEV